jgi:hypothetical protein
MKPIHTIEELEQYKESDWKHKARGFQTICYVYYKGSLSDTVYYVGFTTQNIYHYLFKHHKMKSITARFKEGFSIQLYKTYTENSLIDLFKPTLNKVAGKKIHGRTMGGGDLRFVGEVFQPIRDKKSETNDPSFPCLTIDFVFIYLEKAKNNPLYQKENTFLYSFMQHTAIQEISKDTPGFLIEFLDILEYCKISCLFPAFVSVHEVFLKHALQARSPSDMDTVPIYQDIIDLFIGRSFLTNSIMRYKERSGDTSCQLSYDYRKALLLSISS